MNGYAHHSYKITLFYLPKFATNYCQMKRTATLWVTLCLITLSPNSIQAQLDSWEMLFDEHRNVTLRDVDAHGDTIIAVGPDIGTFTPHIFRSIDDGATWDTLQVGQGPLLRSVQFSDSQHGIISSVNTNSCVLRTSDGGYTWNWGWCDTDSNFTGINQVEFIDDQTAYAFGWGKLAFVSGVMYRSNDAGITWSHVTGNLPDQPIEFAQFLNVNEGYTGSFLFGHSELYRTLDAGQSWTKLTELDSVQFGNAYFLSTAEGFVTTGRGDVLHSTDSGNTWASVHHEDAVFFSSIEFADKSVGVAIGTSTSNRPIVIYTTDGGLSWTKVTSIPIHYHLQKVKFANDRFYVVSGAGEVMRSAKVALSIGSTTEQDESKTLELYPHPGSSHEPMYIHVPANTELSIDILDISGHVLNHLELSEGKTPLSLYAPGVYFYSGKDQIGQVYRGKFVVH